MLTEDQREQESQNDRRNPDWDLLQAYVGSIVVGGVSPLVPGWMTGLWQGVPLASILGAVIGLVWAILTVIVIAAVGAESRQSATCWMWGLLSAGVMLLSWGWWLPLMHY